MSEIPIEFQGILRALQFQYRWQFGWDDPFNCHSTVCWDLYQLGWAPRLFECQCAQRRSCRQQESHGNLGLQAQALPTKRAWIILRSWWLGKPPNESKWLELDLPILSPFQNWILKSTSSNLHTLSSLGSGSKPWYPDGTLKSSERYSLMPYNALYRCYSIAGWLFSQSYCICRGKLTHRSAHAIPPGLERLSRIQSVWMLHQASGAWLWIPHWGSPRAKTQDIPRPNHIWMVVS